MNKVYLHEKVWMIEDFLSQEEIDWFKQFTDDPDGWYITMRSPYKNIMNKFIGNTQKLDENGLVTFPDPEEKAERFPILDEHIFPRLKSVMPNYYRPHQTLQSFKYMTDEEIKCNIQEAWAQDLPVDFAMPYHEDRMAPKSLTNATFALYLNDDYEGGELEFRDLPIKIKPKAGSLVVIEVADGLIHKVNKIKSGNSRHTLYGNSWNSENEIPESSEENC